MATVYLLTKVGAPLEDAQRRLLENKLSAIYAEKWRDIGNGCYLVSSPATDVTEDVSNNAGITDGSAGAFIVSPVKPYYGWANGSIWEWIDAND